MVHAGGVELTMKLNANYAQMRKGANTLVSLPEMCSQEV